MCSVDTLSYCYDWIQWPVYFHLSIAGRYFSRTNITFLTMCCVCTTCRWSDELSCLKNPRTVQQRGGHTLRCSWPRPALSRAQSTKLWNLRVGHSPHRTHTRVFKISPLFMLLLDTLACTHHYFQSELSLCIWQVLDHLCVMLCVCSRGRTEISV